MEIIFNCPHCDQELAVDSEGAGSEIKCPTCGELTMFSTEGAQDMTELNRKRAAFEKDLKRTHPNHDLSRQKFW